MDGKSNQVKVFVVCLVTAAFIWLMDAINTGVHTIKINYPVKFAYDDSLYFPQGELPEVVAINVSGKGWGLLSRYLKSFSDTPVYYSVSNPLKATRIDSIQLKERIAERFEGLNVQFAGNEWEDRLKFDVKTYKVVPLKIDSAGIVLAPGYSITSYINMSPSLLSVEGPATLVKQFPDSVVVRIPETGIRTNYESDLRLDLPRAPALKLSHESVYVSFEVSQI
ncbi:hypothetical protein GCM10023091_20550 [Ravibacter arvi]|uniref:YbbR-like domain-containing protein n=1 Tax=Ravibacter arvi TaxID=2051041 RepID=A0ABP8LWS9_9BACT